MKLANVKYTNIRTLQRNYKKLVETLSKDNQPIIVMTKTQPLFVIISIKMLEPL